MPPTVVFTLPAGSVTRNQRIFTNSSHLDGSGYPQDLNKGRIHLNTRVVTMAEVVETMPSYRPYRPKLSSEQDLEEISRGRGLQYDCSVVDTCLQVYSNKTFQFKT